MSRRQEPIHFLPQNMLQKSKCSISGYLQTPCLNICIFNIWYLCLIVGLANGTKSIGSIQPLCIWSRIIQIGYSRKQHFSIIILIKTVYVIGEEIVCCLIIVRGIRLMTLGVLSWSVAYLTRDPYGITSTIVVYSWNSYQ